MAVQGVFMAVGGGYMHGVGSRDTDTCKKKSGHSLSLFA